MQEGLALAKVFVQKLLEICRKRKKSFRETLHSIRQKNESFVILKVENHQIHRDITDNRIAGALRLMHSFGHA